MILLNSIWLYALAALSIPVAIHLWNVRPGKTLKVGSISLIDASAQKSSRSIKLHDILLLFLRCLLLVLVAVVLAIPVWQKYISASSVKGWLLIPKENISESYQKFKPGIDSLGSAGYEFHYFDKGFAKADLKEVLIDNKNLKQGADSSNISYWTLLQQLNRQLPSSVPVYLFTPNRISHFTGSKPEVALNLRWQTYTPADSASTWINKAWLSDNNDIQVLEGTAKASGTSYTGYTIRSGNNRNSGFIVNTDNGRLTVSLKNSGQQVIVDTSTWRFAIYADKNKADAAYVIAALRSITEFAKHKAVIKQYANPDQIQEHQKWIFWLEQEPARDQYKNNADNFFAYETGNFNTVDSWINEGRQDLSGSKIALYKTIDNTNDSNQPIWQDGYGRAILSLEKADRYNRYHFYTRFSPAYNDLVWSDEFPKMLFGLIVKNEEPDITHYRRTLDTRQMMPVMAKGTNSPGKITEQVDLYHYAWLLLALVFVMERWLANKRPAPVAGRKVLQNG